MKNGEKPRAFWTYRDAPTPPSRETSAAKGNEKQGGEGHRHTRPTPAAGASVQTRSCPACVCRWGGAAAGVSGRLSPSHTMGPGPPLPRSLKAPESDQQARGDAIMADFAGSHTGLLQWLQEKAGAARALVLAPGPGVMLLPVTHRSSPMPWQPGVAVPRPHFVKNADHRALVHTHRRHPPLGARSQSSFGAHVSVISHPERTLMLSWECQRSESEVGEPTTPRRLFNSQEVAGGRSRENLQKAGGRTI